MGPAATPSCLSPTLLPSSRSYAILFPLYLYVQSFLSFKHFFFSSYKLSPVLFLLTPSLILITVLFISLCSLLFEENTYFLISTSSLPVVHSQPALHLPLLPSAHFLIPSSSNEAVFSCCEAQRELWQTLHEETLVNKIPNHP